MNKLLLFDGNALMHRAYHALPPLTTKKGEPINAVYGLTSMLLRVITDHSPTHIAFAFDRPEPTFRKEIHKEYQAQRPEMEDELAGQFEKVYQVLSAMGIPVYSKAGFEADDVIGTVAKIASEETRNKTQETKIDEVIIVTGDRDMLQLVDNETELLMPGRGLSDSKLYGESETIERMGVAPSQIVDLKALMGDASDNYKGVPGVGPKTAIKLIEDYKTLENIYRNIDKLPSNVAVKLRENRESADMSYMLAKIRTDVPIDFDLETTSKWKIDSKDLIELFEEYGFNTLTSRVKSVGKSVTSSKQQSLL